MTCTLVLTIAAALGMARQEPGAVTRTQRLEPGATVTQQIALDEKHSYTISVAPGQFLRFMIEPAGVDLAVALAAPDGRPLVTIDSARSRAPASISIEADAGGDYTLTARAVKEVPSAGTYAVRVEVRAPTAQDRSRVEAERLMREAVPAATDGAKAEQAVATFAQTLALWREVGDRYEEAQALYWTGRAHQRLSQPSTALEFFERALAIDREIEARAQEGVVLNTMGMAYNALSRHDKAIEALDEAVAIGRELNDRDDQAMALNNMGIAYTNLSRNEKAIEVLEQALALNRALKNRAREASALNGLANANRQMNRYDRALEYYLQAVALHRETGNRFDEGQTLANVAIVYHQTGRYDRALTYYEQALAIHKEMKNRTGEGIVLNNMGIAFMDMGRDEAAIKSLEQALAIAREVKRRGGEANSLQNLGNAHRNLKRYEQALEYYGQALAMQREVKNRMGEGSLLNNLGGVAHSLRQYDKAIEYSQQALAIAREVKERADEAAALRNLARTERDRGNLARARSLLEQDLAINEALRADIYNPLSRATYFATQQGALDTYIDVLMRLHAASPTERFDVLAFESSERARARSLLELLTEAGAGIRQGVDVALLDRERALALEVNRKGAEQAQLLARAHTPEQAAAMNKAITELETEYEHTQAQVRRTSPRYAAIAQPEPLALREIQAQVLDPETLLLEYSLGEDRSYIWAVGTDLVSSHELPNREEIQKASRELLDLLTTRRDDSGLSEAAQRLSEMVLRPVASRLPGKRLLVVADGALQVRAVCDAPNPARGGRCGWSIDAARCRARDRHSSVGIDALRHAEGAGIAQARSAYAGTRRRSSLLGRRSTRQQRFAPAGAGKAGPRVRSRDPHTRASGRELHRNERCSAHDSAAALYQAGSRSHPGRGIASRNLRRHRFQGEQAYSSRRRARKLSLRAFRDARVPGQRAARLLSARPVDGGRARQSAGRFSPRQRGLQPHAPSRARRPQRVSDRSRQRDQK